MKDSEFVFDYIQLLYHKCHKINSNCGGSYIDSPDWVKNKKATINPINTKYNKCFQQICCNSRVKLWRNKKRSAKNNSNCEKQVILLMISNREKLWPYLAVKKLSVLLRGTTSKYYSIFIVWIAFIPLEKKIKSHKKVCENKFL